MVLTMFLVFSVGLAVVYVAGRFSPADQGAIGFTRQLLFFFGVLANGFGVGLVTTGMRHKWAATSVAPGYTLAANGVWFVMAASMIMQYVAISRRYQRGCWKDISLVPSGDTEVLH